MEITGNRICEEAWRAFDLWRQLYDPDGDMTVYEQAQSYGRWLDYRACLESAALSRT